MVSLPIYNQSGSQVGSYEIDPAVLAPRISKQLLHDAVVMYQRNLRQGTAKTKNRSDVAGTTKKMYRQKGTGNARAGSRRSGIRRGGGHIHAVHPRDWTCRLPRKALQTATRMALAAKIADGEVVVIDQLALAAPRTRDMAGVLKAIKLDGTSVLVATTAYDENVYKSARNIAGVEIAPAAELNALNLLRPRRVLITKAALDAVIERAKAVRKAAP